MTDVAMMLQYPLQYSRSDILAALREVYTEKEALRERMRRAQQNLDDGNDCYDSLEEAVDATRRTLAVLRNQLR